MCKFLSFYQKNLKAVKYDNIKTFLYKLESESKKEMKSVFNTLHITRKKLTDHGSGVLY